MKYYNINFTDTGGDTCTIDSTSGRAIFTDSVPAGGIATFILNNKHIMANSVIDISLKYDIQAGGYPTRCCEIVNDGQLILFIFNPDTNMSSLPLTVDFSL